ncbi:MAG: helix-turn-helix transcriptional regulator [Myxococcales bacterium]|nr:helix-turn-helix transcriptional regulator [Myxococcales bacterium]
MEPDELRARLAIRIRELAKRRKLRLIDLADQAGVSRGYLWAVLAGENAATIDYLCRIANVLQVDPHELLRPPRKPKASK